MFSLSCLASQGLYDLSGYPILPGLQSFTGPPQFSIVLVPLTTACSPSWKEDTQLIGACKSIEPCTTQWVELLCLQSKNLTLLSFCSFYKSVRAKKISTAFLCEESRLNGTYSLADSLSGPASLPVPAIVYQGDLDCRSGCLHVKEEMYIGLSALLLFDVLKGD